MPNMEQYVNFKPEQDIPSQAGRVIFITGGTAGIGRATIISLAKHQPAHIYFTGRNRQAAEEVAQEVRGIDARVGTTFIKMDMTSIVNVKQACAQFIHDRLDTLICNAGVMYIAPGLSAEGYENHFAINHLAHAMIIRQLLPTLERTTKLPDSDVRVVSLTSLAWKYAPKNGITFETLRTTQEGFMGGNYRYGQSKLANLVYASSLAHHVPSSATHNSQEKKGNGIVFVSVHPGTVRTGLTTTKLGFFERLMIWLFLWSEGLTLMEEHEGAFSQLWAAAGASREELVNGGWYMPVGRYSEDRLQGVVKSEELRDELWTYTESVLDQY